MNELNATELYPFKRIKMVNLMLSVFYCNKKKNPQKVYKAKAIHKAKFGLQVSFIWLQGVLNFGKQFQQGGISHKNNSDEQFVQKNLKPQPYFGCICTWKGWEEGWSKGGVPVPSNCFPSAFTSLLVPAWPPETLSIGLPILAQNNQKRGQ